MTPLQVGELFFLRRHANAKLTEAGATVCVNPPTLREAMKDLVRRRWVTKRRSVTDTRAMCFLLSRRGAALAFQSEHRVRHVRSR